MFDFDLAAPFANRRDIHFNKLDILYDSLFNSIQNMMSMHSLIAYSQNIEIILTHKVADGLRIVDDRD